MDDSLRPRSPGLGVVLAGAVVMLSFGSGCSTARSGSRSPELPRDCGTMLNAAQDSGADGRVEAYLPFKSKRITESIDFADEEDLFALSRTACRATAMFDWFNLLIDVEETPEMLVRRAAESAATAMGYEIAVGGLTTGQGRDVSGWYAYDGWAPSSKTPRKGWIAVVTDSERAYWLALETDAGSWDRLEALFRESGATLKLIAP